MHGNGRMTDHERGAGNGRVLRTAIAGVAMIAITFALTVALVPSARAAEEEAATTAATTAPLYGGAVSTTQAHVFETVVSPDGIRVYLYTDELAPAMVEKATGTAMLKLPGGKSMELKLVAQKPADEKRGVFFCPMHPEVVQDQPGKCEPCRGMILYHQDALFGKADLAGVKPEELSAMIRIKGLRGREKEATFAPAFRTPERKAANEKSGEKHEKQTTR